MASTIRDNSTSDVWKFCQNWTSRLDIGFDLQIVDNINIIQLAVYVCNYACRAQIQIKTIRIITYNNCR